MPFQDKMGHAWYDGLYIDCGISLDANVSYSYKQD